MKIISIIYGVRAGLARACLLTRISRKGGAGEFGHTVVDKNGPIGRCGGKGCLGAICGNNAIIRDAMEAARQGNSALNAIYRRVGRTLGIGVNNLRKSLIPLNGGFFSMVLDGTKMSTPSESAFMPILFRVLTCGVFSKA